MGNFRDPCLVPHGPYCYKRVREPEFVPNYDYPTMKISRCPYWFTYRMYSSEFEEEIPVCGCNWLKIIDVDDFLLLDDQVKECTINNEEY